MAEVSTQEIQVAEEATEQDIQLQELRKANLELRTQLQESNQRALQVFQEKQQLQASPEVAREMSKLEFDMKQAEYFVRSNALPVKNAAQAYVIMKMGEEIGLSHMVAIQALYIVNGQMAFHGKHLAGRLTGLGYKIDFTNESREGVDVTISKGDFMETYCVKRTEELLKNSKAMAFASTNKMRFHGIRQIANFHLAHLFNGIPLWDEDDMQSAEKRSGDYDSPAKIDEDKEQEILKNISKSSKSDLVSYWNILDNAEKTPLVKTAFTNRKRQLING